MDEDHQQLARPILSHEMAGYSPIFASGLAPGREGPPFSALEQSARRIFRLTLSQIAGLLGYPELSAFNRTWRQWFDLTLMKVRARL